MLGKIIARSAATTAVVGTVLAVAATTTPAVVTTAPEIRNVACNPGYPGTIATTTDLELAQNLGPYGAGNRATVTVDSVGNSATPSGYVTVKIRETGWTRNIDLNSSGKAGVSLPRTMDAGETYTVVARYRPACDQFAASSDTARYTIVKAGTDLAALKAGDRKRGGKPVVSGTVSSTRAPGGRVRVTISNGTSRQTETVSLTKEGAGVSTFRAVFGRTWKRGQWNVKATYLGTRNFERSSGTTSFKITR